MYDYLSKTKALSYSNTQQRQMNNLWSQLPGCGTDTVKLSTHLTNKLLLNNSDNSWWCHTKIRVSELAILRKWYKTRIKFASELLSTDSWSQHCNDGKKNFYELLQKLCMNCLEQWTNAYTRVHVGTWALRPV